MTGSAVTMTPENKVQSTVLKREGKHLLKKVGRMQNAATRRQSINNDEHYYPMLIKRTTKAQIACPSTRLDSLLFLSGTVFISHNFLQHSSKPSKFLQNSSKQTSPKSLTMPAVGLGGSSPPYRSWACGAP